ncbi:D-ribose ABC transporter substrate-binding protein [Devosia pacifica]|uniref:D-ribose ABC transporter substrate-binding protein n=1 Tax=Devosia pacifica TaxID=1335967 RepID=A0A918VZA8_9HYPH|nr:substrate-binding domain-containing protein [Devosia pacifica]GHA39360.1 D-ribose ABC transporter substrate-binding protein [Devosia pacifica]
MTKMFKMSAVVAAMLMTTTAVHAQTYQYNTVPEGDITLCFSQVVMNHPFRVAMVESFEQVVAGMEGVTGVVTDAQGDATREIANIESLIARGCNAIIVSSLSGRAIYPAYREVADAGIPLIIAASGVPEEEGIPYVSFVSTEEVSMGERAFDYIAARLGGEGNIVQLQGVPESTNSILRREGFNAQAQYWPNIVTVADQSGQWLRLPARQVMANILQANSDIDAVFAYNDEMALGAIQALEDAGRTDVFVVGMDGQKESLEVIQSGDLFAMTIANEWRMDTAIETAVAAVRGEAVPQRVVLRVPMITDDNIDAHYDPEAVF